MAFALRQEATSYWGTNGPVITKPGFMERSMVIVASFVLLHGLPIDWFRTNTEVTNSDGNLKMVIAQLALMGFAFLRVAGSFDWLVRVVKLEPTVFVFGGFALASLFWSADTEESFRQGIVLMTIAVYAGYLVLRFALDELIRLLGTMFAIGGVCSMVFALAFPRYGVEFERWDGVFYNKNALGFSCVMAIPILIAAGRSTVKWRFFYYFSIPIQVALLIGSQSKTMLVAAAGSVGLMLVFRMFRGRRTFRGAVMLSLVGSSTFTVLFVTANIAILARWLDKDVSLTGRVPLWQDLWPFLFERPLFGFGYRAAFGGYFSPMHDIWIIHDWQPSHPHNALYLIALDLGLIGLAIFMVSFFRSVKRAVHCVNLVPGPVGIWPLTLLSTALLIGISESGITYDNTAWLLYAITALYVANTYKSAEKGLQAEIDADRADERDREALLATNGLGLVSADIR